MNPIKFPQAKTSLAKNQPQYRVLPVDIGETEDNGINRYTCKYEISDLELAQIIKTKSLYFSQFGGCFHPILPQIESPYGVCTITYQCLDKVNYDFWIPMLNGEIIELKGIRLGVAIDILEETTKLSAEQLFFIEKPTMAIAEDGSLIDL